MPATSGRLCRCGDRVTARGNAAFLRIRELEHKARLDAFLAEGCIIEQVAVMCRASVYRVVSITAGGVFMLTEPLGERRIATATSTRTPALLRPLSRAIRPSSASEESEGYEKFEDFEPAQQSALTAQPTWSSPHVLYWPLKRAFDIVLAVIVILILLVILVPISILLLLEDGGPPIYRGRAIGLDGRRFKVYKIRTMRRDADGYLDQHPELKATFLEHFKLVDDPRVHRIGRFLRRTSLDELPQAINVLLGDMSWVGPRYVKDEELKRYGTFAPLRLCMRPGVTGLWQISGRSNLPYPLRTVYDRTYYYTRSLWTDFKILLLTVPAVLRRHGAV